MTDRIIELSENPARLKVNLDRLLVEGVTPEPLAVPMEDIAVLLLGNPQITLTHPVLARLMVAGGSIIACDDNRLPVGLMLPLEGHTTQSRRFAAQAGAKRPVNKRLWQQIIQAKIRAQARLLQELRETDAGLLKMAERVRSGDPDNLEAQAAARYWPRVFGIRGFRRARDGSPPNGMLNYGYTVLRAMIGRAICAAGLHPSLGISHHNQYNAFCLADDLIEPFRPVVDRATARYIAGNGMPTDAVPATARRAMLELLTDRFEVEGESRTLFDLASRAASTLAQVYLGEAQAVNLPSL